jgi:hypothetical protein
MTPFMTATPNNAMNPMPDATLSVTPVKIVGLQRIYARFIRLRS